MIHKVSSFLYFLAAAVLLVGLLFLGGYVGKRSVTTHYTAGSQMARLVGDQNSQDDGSAGGGCASCKWY